MPQNFKNYSKPKQVVADKSSTFRSRVIYDFMSEYNIEP